MQKWFYEATPWIKGYQTQACVGQKSLEGTAVNYCVYRIYQQINKERNPQLQQKKGGLAKKKQKTV